MRQPQQMAEKLARSHKARSEGNDIAAMIKTIQRDGPVQMKGLATTLRTTVNRISNLVAQHPLVFEVVKDHREAGKRVVNLTRTWMQKPKD